MATLPDMLLIDGVEYRRCDRDEPVEPEYPPTPWTWSDTKGHFYDANGAIVWMGRDETTNFIVLATAHHAELLAFVELCTKAAWCSMHVEAKSLLAKVKGT